MAFNKNKPAGSDKIRLSDDVIRENWQALEDAISAGHEFATGGEQTGKHKAPVFKDNGGEPSQPTEENEVTLYNNAGLMYFLNQAGTKRTLGPIPSGTKMVFKQPSAPTGWTFNSEDNDKVLLTTDTVAEGGTTGGSWTISGLTAASHTHTHSHRHNYTVRFSGKVGSGSEYSNVKSVWDYTSSAFKSETTNDSQVEVPTSTPDTSETSGATATVNSNGSWRPSFVKCITCTKD